MNTYQIAVTENLQRVFELKANSEGEAIQIINEKYKNEDIVLDYSDCISKEISLYDDNAPDKNALIEQVIAYFWEDEKKHFNELDNPDNHIYLALKALNKII